MNGFYFCIVIRKYFSFVTFSHTVFALPFALIGFTLALTETNAIFQWQSLLFVLLCMVFARNAAMGFNRWADSDIDSINERTTGREIPSGQITKRSALVFILLNSFAFILTAYFINPLCFFLSPIVLAIILFYSYTKRFTPLCHFVLGLGLSIAPIGAFLAVQPQFYFPVFILSAVVLLWVSGFDIIYSLQDEEFDKEHQLYSIPSFLGKKKALQVAKLLHIFCSVLIIYFGSELQAGFLYWIGAAGFIALLAYQHFLVSPNDLSKVNRAFFTTNGLASILFACFVIMHLLFN